jgi:outer membrane protein assembly factor BamD
MTAAREAYADFAQLLARYPNSEYVPDARQRMIYLRDVLAQAELNVADYYMRRGAYVAASNRARYVLETYPRSSAIPDALALAVEANYKLGLQDAANDALRVLSMNFPDYPAFDEFGQLVLAEAVRNRDRSWINLMTLGLLDRPDVPPPLTIQQPNDNAPQAHSATGRGGPADA